MAQQDDENDIGMTMTPPAVVTMDPMLMLNHRRHGQQRLGTLASRENVHCSRQAADGAVLKTSSGTTQCSAQNFWLSPGNTQRTHEGVVPRYSRVFCMTALCSTAVFLVVFLLSSPPGVSGFEDCHATSLLSSGNVVRTKRQAVATNAIDTKTITKPDFDLPEQPADTNKLTGRLNLGIGRYQQQPAQQHTRMRQNWLQNRAMTRPVIPYSPNYYGNNNNGVSTYPAFNQMFTNNKYGADTRFSNMDGGGGFAPPAMSGGGAVGGGLGSELPSGQGLGGNGNNNAFATLQMAQQTNQQNLASIPVNQDYETPIDQSRRYSPIQNPAGGGGGSELDLLAGRQGGTGQGSPAGIIAASQVNPLAAQQQTAAGTNVIGNYYQAPQNLESIEEQAKRKKAREALEALCKAPDAEPKCRKTVYDMCMHDDLYPIDAAEEVLSEAYNQVRRMHVTKEYTDSDLYDTGNSAKHNRFVDFVHEMFTDGEYDNLPGIPERRIRICTSSSMFFQPGWAKTLDGRWVVVFNSHRIKQHLRAELCEADGEKCNHVPKCYHSVCKQRYRPELLVTFDPCNTLADPVMETFYIPDGCDCFTDHDDDEVPTTTTTTTQAPPTSADKRLTAKELKAKQKEVEEKKHFNKANKFQNKTPPTQKRRVKEQSSNMHAKLAKKHQHQHHQLHSRKQTFMEEIRSTTTSTTPKTTTTTTFTTTTTTSTTPSPRRDATLVTDDSHATIVNVNPGTRIHQRRPQRPTQVTVSLSDGAEADDSNHLSNDDDDEALNSSESLADVDIHKIARRPRPSEVNVDFSRRTMPHSGKAATIEVDVAPEDQKNTLQERRKNPAENNIREQQIMNQLGGLFDLASTSGSGRPALDDSAVTKNQRRSASSLLAEAAERSFGAEPIYPVIGGGGGMMRERTNEKAPAAAPHGLAALR